MSLTVPIKDCQRCSGQHPSIQPSEVRWLPQAAAPACSRRQYSGDRDFQPSKLALLAYRARIFDQALTLCKKCHEEVVLKLLRLFAILLELPDEEQLVQDHQYDVKGEDHLRCKCHSFTKLPIRPKQHGTCSFVPHSTNRHDTGSLLLQWL